jgi:Zn-dependent protease
LIPGAAANSIRQGRDDGAPMKGFVRLTRIAGVTVYMHWSVIAVTMVLLLNAIRDAAVTVFLLFAYLAVLLLHEAGHALAAQRLGYRVWSIEMYPFHGLTRYEAPASHYHACVVAWGGVLAQLMVALPLIYWSATFGFTRVGVFNALIAIFGYLSAVIAVLNLLPVGRLDGATAWQIVPYLWRRYVKRTPRPPRTDKRVEPARTKGDWIH